MWDMVVGGSAISTGGGGIGPTREQFDAFVDPILEQGVQPTLISPDELDKDATVFMHIGAGGGVRAVDRERYLTPGIAGVWRSDIDRDQWFRQQLREIDRLYPIGSCADLDGAGL